METRKELLQTGKIMQIILEAVKRYSGIYTIFEIVTSVTNISNNETMVIRSINNLICNNQIIAKNGKLHVILNA